jgi:hypothetical protein
MIGSRALGFLLLFAPSIALADGTPDQAIAQTLFDEGVKLMEQGRYAEACPKLAESQRLDPGGGTLLNLGLCYEKEGKLASAWITYNASLSQAIKDGRKEREETSKARVIALEPTLAKIVITVPDNVAHLPGLEVAIDGVRIGSAAWGVPSPIDVGNHVMTVSAKEKRTWQQSVAVSRDGQTVTVTVPSLANAPQERHPDGTPKPSSLRPIGLVIGAVGVAGIGVGVVGGIMTVVKRSDSNKACPVNAGVMMCTQPGVDANDQAKTWAWVSNIGFGVGIAGIAVGTIFYILGKPAPAQKTGLYIGPDGAGYSGTF